MKDTVRDRRRQVTAWEENISKTSNVSDWYPKFIKNSSNSTVGKTAHLKTGKEIWADASPNQEDTRMANTYLKRRSVLCVTAELHIKAAAGSHDRPVTVARAPGTIVPNAGGEGAKERSSSLLRDARQGRPFTISSKAKKLSTLSTCLPKDTYS